jgi:hypothetical protein
MRTIIFVGFPKSQSASAGPTSRQVGGYVYVVEVIEAVFEAVFPIEVAPLGCDL